MPFHCQHVHHSCFWVLKMDFIFLSIMMNIHASMDCIQIILYNSQISGYKRFCNFFTHPVQFSVNIRSPLNFSNGVPLLPKSLGTGASLFMQFCHLFATFTPFNGVSIVVQKEGFGERIFLAKYQISFPFLQ